MRLKGDQNQNDLQNKINFRLIIHIVCIVGFLCCAIWLIWYFASSYHNSELMKDVQEHYMVTPLPMDEPPTAEPGPTTEPNLFSGRMYPDFTGLDVPELKPDFTGLQEMNPDIYAWIFVPDTAVNYPVVQRAGDANYYLRRDIEGNRSTPGTIFTQYYNNKDWTDNLTVVYGHNMRDGSMFGSLHYFEDSQFFQEHPYIYIYTPDYTLVYQVFASYEYSDIHLLLNYTMNDRDTFTLYLGQVLALDGLNVNINRDVEVTADDRVLTLSTCVSVDSEDRYLVQAKLFAVEKTAKSEEAAENGELTGRADTDLE